MDKRLAEAAAPQDLPHVSANRLGREVRDIADLLSAAVCRGEAEVAARYWRELGELIGVRAGASA